MNESTPTAFQKYASMAILWIALLLTIAGSTIAGYVLNIYMGFATGMIILFYSSLLYLFLNNVKEFRTKLLAAPIAKITFKTGLFTCLSFLHEIVLLAIFLYYRWDWLFAMYLFNVVVVWTCKILLRRYRKKIE